MKVETKNFVKENFQQQGFQSAGFQEWKPRKTTDTRGRDLRYYKRGKRKGKLTRFGRKHEGRAILIGHDSENKMRDSFRSVREGNKLNFFARDYAIYHNEGTGHLPPRKMIGKSPHLISQIRKALETGN